MVRRRCRGDAVDAEGVANAHPPQQHACAFPIYRTLAKVPLPFIRGVFLLLLQLNGF